MSNETKKGRGEKLKKEVVLFGQEDKLIYQSNRVTNGKFRGFSLIQGKILSCVINELQGAIKLNMEGKSIQQLDMFEESEKNIFRITVPMAMIGMPRQYAEIQESAKQMLSLIVELKAKHEEKENVSFVLFHKVGTPTKESNKKVLNLFMTKEAANYLVDVNKKVDGTPKEFTTYRLSVSLNAKTKYSQKLYWIISSWKNRGGFVIALDDLREQLGLDKTEYSNYADFKRRVLVPAQKDLQENSDCWFNCQARDFEMKHTSSKKVIKLNFKIIQKADSEMFGKQADNVRNILKMHAQFSSAHLDELRPIFNEAVDINLVATKTVELIQYVNDPDNRVGNKQAYIIKSLLNKFC